jgi:hypothetical protein
VSLVARLKADLIAAGARIWIDHEQLQPGAPDWEEAVRAGIQRAAFVLYIASPEARAPHSMCATRSTWRGPRAAG